MANWTEADAPALGGRIYVVTGANSGIGYEVTRMLADKGAMVVMACRSQARADAALARLKAKVPAALAEVMRLDLADLASVREFATAFESKHARLDGLINNAGLMALPRQTTAQGFEMQFGVNHLGHFALTARLWPRLTGTPASRIVNVSSEVHRSGRIDFGDLMGERRYSRWGAYMQSKLANILFTRKLQQKLSSLGADGAAMACHPGYTATELQGRSDNAFENFFFKQLTNRVVAQSPAMGALPTLRAAVDRSLAGGSYVGPKGLFGARGYPVVVKPSAAARVDADADRLWTVSESLTAESFG